MPNLDDVFNKPEEKITENLSLIKLGGKRPCGKCEEDVIGALWDENTRIMTWKCHLCKHENSFQVD